VRIPFITKVSRVDDLGRPGRPRSWVELLFLSFTTLSSTGLSDVIPSSPSRAACRCSSGSARLAYVAMVVSRLVGLMVMRPHVSTDD
jgi:hypothetical protein